MHTHAAVLEALAGGGVYEVRGYGRAVSQPLGIVRHEPRLRLPCNIAPSAATDGLLSTSPSARCILAVAQDHVGLNGTLNQQRYVQRNVVPGRESLYLSTLHVFCRCRQS